MAWRFASGLRMDVWEARSCNRRSHAQDVAIMYTTPVQRLLRRHLSMADNAVILGCRAVLSKVIMRSHHGPGSALFGFGGLG